MGQESSGDEGLEVTENIEDGSDSECKPIEFGAKSSQKILAVDRQITVWKEYTKTAEGHQEDEWCRAWQTWKLVNKYTGHKTVLPFRAYEKDVVMFELDSVTQNDKAKTEKILKEH